MLYICYIYVVHFSDRFQIYNFLVKIKHFTFNTFVALFFIYLYILLAFLKLSHLFIIQKAAR